MTPTAEDLPDEVLVLVNPYATDAVCFDLFAERWDAEDLVSASSTAFGIAVTWLLGGYMLPILTLAVIQCLAYAFVGFAMLGGAMVMASPTKLDVVLDAMQDRYAGASPETPRIELVHVPPDAVTSPWLVASATTLMATAAHAAFPDRWSVGAGIAAFVALAYLEIGPFDRKARPSSTFTRDGLANYLLDRPETSDDAARPN